MTKTLLYCVIAGTVTVLTFTVLTAGKRQGESEFSEISKPVVPSASIDSITRLPEGTTITISSVQVVGIEKDGFTVIDGSEPVSGVYVHGLPEGLVKEMSIESLKGKVMLRDGRKVLKLVYMEKSSSP